MRMIEWTNQFKRDFKREIKGSYRATLDSDLFSIVERLANDELIEVRYRDHALSGNWKGHRDCHIKPDLVLIYQKPEPGIMLLVRLGSHAELDL